MNKTNLDTNGEALAIVIFGITGDLTRRKLLPALYELLKAGKLMQPIYIIGFARREWSDEFLREQLRHGVVENSRSRPVETETMDALLAHAHYICSTFKDPQGYRQLHRFFDENRIQNVLFYLATPPEEYRTIAEMIGNEKINKRDHGWTRIVIEKPYGEDIESATLLEQIVHRVFSEKQVYRIDHYLGKETVQNILVFRFANAIFEPLWDRRYVDHVQITVSETVGVGTRAGYYDHAGVVRDMFQNHLLQLVTLTAMEAPVGFNADAVRDEKVKVLKALRPLKGMDALLNTFRAQYVSGTIDGKRVAGYKDEAGVPGSSLTETLLAARLHIDNWRWSGVPFFVRSGKRMPVRLTEIVIRFRQAPLSLFDWHNLAGDAPNTLVLSLQPNEGITLEFGAKSPRPINQIAAVKMEFDYQTTFGSEPPEAYERLLLDCMMGDATLFTRSDEVLGQWEFTSNILNAWRQSNARNLPVYEAGTWGPPGLDAFIQQDNRTWRNPA
ncbi:MAG: glucose-6-phosphate dehydrogenase [Bellilinea sp.]|jgi:glucose-6-phosphate 1-dehydrogenase